MKNRKSIISMAALCVALLLFPWAAMAADIAVPQTGVTEISVTGDDGDFQAGVPFPVPRFTDNGDGTVTDNLTGLVWLKNANCFGAQTWSDAIASANTLYDGQEDPDCGLHDGSTAEQELWRMPNIRELVSLINFKFVSDGDYPAVYLSNTQGNAAWEEGYPFNGVQRWYWSSTNDIDDSENRAHVVNFNKAITNSNDKSTSSVDGIPDENLFVWPVRDLINP